MNKITIPFNSYVHLWINHYHVDDKEIIDVIESLGNNLQDSKSIKTLKKFFDDKWDYEKERVD